jgi:tetratricopeptide (TPR) repeat protein
MLKALTFELSELSPGGLYFQGKNVRFPLDSLSKKTSNFPHARMLLNPHVFPVKVFTIAAFCLVGVMSVSQVNAQAPPPAPGPPMSPGTLNKIFTEAEAAFVAKEYSTAASKIDEILKAIGNNANYPLELLNFNLGLAHLLGGKAQEAEAAFVACVQKFPRGEYASRCYLGIGRAAIMQDTEEKKNRAIEALKVAAKDPKFRSEAGLSLGEVYIDLGKMDEALAVFKSLMGSDIRSPQQTTAAVQVLGLIAANGKIEDLIAYLDRLSNQSGVRDAIAWYANQVIVRADELVGSESYEAALAIYRTVPPRSQIMEVQAEALESQRKDLKLLETKVNAEKDKPIEQRSSASEYISALKPAVELSEAALTIIRDKPDLDSALLMRRGRCLYNLDRLEEALVCFRLIRNKFGTATDAKAAAFGEIVILSKLQSIDKIKELCDDYLRKYPDAENAEQVATLAGEVLVQSGNWAEIGKFYNAIEDSLDRYRFYQAVAKFQEAEFKESNPMFLKFLKDFPTSTSVETAMYYLAMSYFLSNDYKMTLSSCKEYLAKFPDGRYAGDMRYRLSFIDFNDRGTDDDPAAVAKFQDKMYEKVVKDLGGFLAQNPNDASAGSMYSLMGDAYNKRKSEKPDEMAKFQQLAIEVYKKAVWSESPDDVIQYALDNATTLMSGNKDWAGIAALHGEFIKRYPDSLFFLTSVNQVVKMKIREGKTEEATTILVDALKPRIGEPSVEQVEFVLDELVKTIVPRKKAKDLDKEALDKQLQEIITKAIDGKENATTNARLYYARSRLAQLLKDPISAKRHLVGIAKLNAKDPSVLSPALLSVSGDILLELGDVEAAEGMFKRLSDRFREGMFADAGPVGLGFVEMKRKRFAEALKIFEEAVETNPGTSKFKEATVGRIEAMLRLGQLDQAQKLATETIGDKTFRGEFAGKALLLQGEIYRARAKKADTPEAKLDFLKQAHATYNRVFTAYKSTPDVCAEGAWQAYETLIEMGNKELAQETLKTLSTDPKLQNTQRVKDALEQLGK